MTIAVTSEKSIKREWPVRYGFLLTPGFSMIAFSSAVEVLRMANQIAQKELFDWPLFSADGGQVMASNRVSIDADYALNEASQLEALFVCSGVRVSQAWSESLAEQLTLVAQEKVKLGSICTGTYLLARAGLLDGYKCTIHWENIASLRDSSPNLHVTEELFEIDGDRYTCSGGTAPLDMMLNLVAEHTERTLAVAISEQFLCDRMRGTFDKQRIPLKLQIGASQPKLIEAVELMESNLEELISLDELASLVGISRRQLERLFKKYLGCVPRRYYLDLRLKKARQLLLQTSNSISDVAIACGFVSASHFSKSYREKYGLSPRAERQNEPVMQV